MINDFYKDSLDSVRKADIAYNRMMDSLVQSYEAHRGAIEIEHGEGTGESWGTILAIITLVIIFGSFIFYNIFNNRYWERGVFPPMMLNRKGNRYEAIVNLGVNITRFDKSANKEKMVALQRFILRMFPDIHGDLSDSYSSALAQPLTTASICKWLKPKITRVERQLIFEMLFDLAVMDGTMGQKEYAELLLYCQKMGIPESNLADKTQAHKRKYAEQIHEDQQKQYVADKNTNSSYQKEKFMEFLGLEAPLTEAALKKAYRKIAKSCHPDMTRHLADGEKEQLNKRFLEIQEAYEYLLKLL